LVVKIKPGARLPQTQYLKSYKKLFGTTYVFYTNNLRGLADYIKRNRNLFHYAQLDYKSNPSVLPQARQFYRSPILGREWSRAADPMLSRVWAFKDADQNGISVVKAYKSSTNRPKKEIIVAVVDTGVDYTHEDLKANMWVNKKEIPGNGIDDDQNGYIDDVYGIDTLDRDAQGRATGDPKDSHYHGTHVAGTIGSVWNNGKGIAGVASNVKIMAIRTVPNRGDETDVDVAESFIYAAKHGAKIINCSFGKRVNEGGKLIPDTLKYIREKYGVLVIAAAGNSSQNIDNRLTYPASFEASNLFVIASTTSRGRLSGFSNYGKLNVDLASPGSGVLSTVPGNRYSSLSGTSMASPNAAGVAAEVLSRAPQLNPEQLKAVLMKSVTPVAGFRGKMRAEGRIDLYQTLKDNNLL
jgi:subtilisin family serine protease